jgi:hypothetical protein
MGNRAHIQIPGADASIYLHYTGSIESVLAVIDTARERELLGHNPEYSLATLAAAFRVELGFKDGLSMGIEPAFNLEKIDWVELNNGLYIVSAGGELLARWISRPGMSSIPVELDPAELARQVAAARSSDAYKARRARLNAKMDAVNQTPAQLELAI